MSVVSNESTAGPSGTAMAMRDNTGNPGANNEEKPTELSWGRDAEKGSRDGGDIRGAGY